MQLVKFMTSGMGRGAPIVLGLVILSVGLWVVQGTLGTIMAVRFVLKQLMAESQMQASITAIQSIWDAEAAKICDFLDGCVFATRQSIEDAVGLSGAKNPHEVSRSIHRFSQLVREYPNGKATFAEVMPGLLELSGVSPEDAHRLMKLLHMLCLKPTSIDQQQKAIELSQATGCVTFATTIITDIRPVFDSASGQIVGAFPTSTLRIEFDDGDTRRLDFKLDSRILRNSRRKLTEQ